MHTRTRIPALVHHLTYRTPRWCLRPSFTRHAVTSAAGQDVDQEVRNICRQYGVDAAVKVAQGPWGLGLYKQQPTAESSEATNNNSSPQHVYQPDKQHRGIQQDEEQLLVSVPLHLVLSCSIPGCSPTAEQTPKSLQNLLQHHTINQHWELQIAALLLWALRQPTDTSLGGFWQRYAAALIPPLDKQAGLLLWAVQDLTELQDSELQSRALQWQQTARDVYHAAVRPAFDAMLQAGDLQCDHGSGCSSSGGSAGSGAACCTLEDWLWAVAAVESRAFGVLGNTTAQYSAAGAPAAADTDTTSTSSDSSGSSMHSGSCIEEQPVAAAAAAPAASRERVGLVPVLDLANHTSRSNCHHSVDSSAGRFNLCETRSRSGADDSSSSSDGGSSADASTGSSLGPEVLITYGDKDNRQLMEQYGFCVPGNPFNRVRFSQQALQQQQHWMSHTAVKQAARQIKQEQQQQQQQAIAANDAAVDTFVVDAAVASILAAAGWKNLQQYKQVTPRSTALRAQQLLGDVQSQLNAFPTRLAEDQMLLQRLQQQLRAGAMQSSRSMLSGQVSPVGATAEVKRNTGTTRLVEALRYRVDRKRLLEVTALVLRALL